MEGPIPAYEGSGAYAFVSYSHEDAASVFPDVEHLHNEGFAVWYDDGIHAGSSWPTAIAEKIDGCDVFLYFGSQSAAESAHCQRELHFATEAEKPIIVIQVDAKPVPAAVRFVLGQQQALMKLELQQETYRSRLVSALGQHLAPEQASAAAPVSYDGKAMMTIAVTPFEADDPSLADLAETLTEELPRVLMMSDLIPTSPRLVRRAFAENDSPTTLGNKLEVSWIVYGRLRRAGDRVQIQVELTDAINGNSVWIGRLKVPENPEKYIPYLLSQCVGPIFTRVNSRVVADTKDLPIDALDVVGLNARTTLQGSPGGNSATELVERMIELEPANPMPKVLMAQILSAKIARRAQGRSDPDFPASHGTGVRRCATWRRWPDCV